MNEKLDYEWLWEVLKGTLELCTKVYELSEESLKNYNLILNTMLEMEKDPDLNRDNW